MNKKYKKRDVFIVDNTFQFKYSLLFGISGLIISSVIFIIVFNYVKFHDGFLLKTGLEQSEELLSFFKSQQKLLFTKLFMISLIVTLLMFLIGLVISNKIAGPIYSLRRKINEISINANLSTRFSVRKKDEFKDLSEDLNKMMCKLEAVYGKDLNS
jgi:methyl-accepting chemotaxis protein